MSPHLRKKVVVVGHGMVGHRFVTAAIERGLTETHDIVVFGEEPRPAYDRVALTSFFEVGAEALSFLPSGVYEDPRVTLRTSTSVVEIDTAAQTVMLADGEEMAYDELVLATGAAPFVPPVPGSELGNVFVYRTIEDLEAIREAAKTAKTGAVIGGGLLGLEAANALHQLGVETHVVELAPRLMAVQVDDAGGNTLKRHIQKLGLTVHTGVMTESISPDSAAEISVVDEDESGVLDGKVSALKFKDVDEPLPIDMLVFSAGIRPRDALARGAGLTWPSAAAYWSTSSAAPPTRTCGRSASAPRPAAGCTAWWLPATTWPRSSPTRCSVVPARSPVPTCRPSSSCSVSTSLASVTRTAPPTSASS